MSSLTNKKILLGITGGIAAYKSAEIARGLKKVGAEVRVIMTESSKEFITPLNKVKTMIQMVILFVNGFQN